MATRNIVPRDDGEGNIGTSSKSWLSGFFSSLNVLGAMILSQITKPAAPGAGKNKLYFKADNNLYKQNSSGVEVQVDAASAGDMAKAVYDTDDDGIVDSAEVLNDGSSGGGNEVTAAEARTHIDDTNNPHSVTKAQVGLTDVPDLDTTDAVNNEHTQGTDTELDNGGANPISAATIKNHVEDTANPHAVEADQVATADSGIDVQAALDDIESDVDDLETDTHTHSNKTEIDKVTIGDHDVKTDNPHAVVANQVATDDSGETVQDKIDDADAHIADTNNPHSVDKTDVSLANVDDVQQMPLSYLDTDPALAADSDTKTPSQKAIKAYTDALLEANDAMVYKGVIDCGANPNYPAAESGHTYRISVAGKIGGASGEVVEVGDMAICVADSTASGDQVTVGEFWNIIQVNIDGNVVGTSPYSSTDDNLVMFNGTSGKVIEDSGLALSDVTGHIADTANPHAVEADQIATTDSGETVQDKVDDADAHITDMANPHAVEANQIPTDESGLTVQDKLDAFSALPEGINIYLVGKHGNDSNDGKEWTNAKLTIQNAIDAASSGDVVVVVDAGIYTEDIACADGIELYAPNATLDLESGGNQLILADQKTTFRKITRTNGSSHAIGNSGSASTSILVADEIIDAYNSFTIRNLSIGGTLVLYIKNLFINGGGDGISDAGASSSVINLNIDNIYLNSNNATGIQLATTINITGYVHRIIELGSRTGTLALDLNAGATNLNINVINADTAYDVESGAVLNLFCNSLSGTELNDGTANIAIASDVADAITHKDLTDNPHAIEADQVATDDSGVDVQTALDAVESDVDDLKSSSITFIIDGGGSEITTGIKGDIRMPTGFNGTITKVSLLADQSGSIVVDIWEDTYANFPPIDGDSITASAPPTITTAVKSEDATLTGWTKTITAGSTLRFNVDSVTDIERVTLTLEITRT